MTYVLVSGTNEAEHIQNLEAVVLQLQSRGIKVHLDKCRFMQQNIEYLGQKIDATGLHPTRDKIQAILDAPEPTKLSELKSYLGLLSYYGCFV